MIDQVEAEVLRRGPNVPTWNKGGVDLRELVAKAPGGTAGNYILVRSNDGSTNVELVDPTDIDAILPKSWSKVKDFGDSTQKQRPRLLSFGILDGQQVLVEWDQTRKVGDAFCWTKESGIALYRDSAREAGEMPEGFIDLLLSRMFDRIREKDICWRYDPQGSGFRKSYFFPNGDSLPSLTEEGEVATIVPAGDINALVKAGEPTP